MLRAIRRTILVLLLLVAIAAAIIAAVVLTSSNSSVPFHNVVAHDAHQAITQLEKLIGVYSR